MAQVAIADASFAGFKLLTTRPLAALAWGVVQVLLVVLLLVAVGGAFLAPFLSLVQQGPNIDPSKIAPLVGGLLGAEAVFVVGALLVNAVISAAVIRSVLEPDNRGFAYLRLGAQELWLVAVFFVEALLFFVVTLVLALIVGALVTATHNNGFVIFLGVVAIIAGLIYLSLRFSLAAPLTFADRRFRLFHSWGLTSGHVGSLFLVGLIVFALLFCVYIVNFIVSLIVNVITAGFTASALQGAGAGQMQAMLQHPLSLIGQMAPIIIVQIILGIIFSSIVLSVTIAPWAEAYRQLKPGPDVAGTFT